MREVDQHRIVVEEVGVGGQAFCQIVGQHMDVCVLEHHGHHRQLGTFQVKTGAGCALRFNGHGMR
jgi:hypothetical protein